MTQTFDPVHCGLFFGPDALKRARQSAQRPPFQAAWAYLRAEIDQPPLLRSALCWHFDESAAHGEQASAKVLDALATASAVDDLVRLAQTIELLRDHPSAPLSDWLDALTARVDALPELAPDAPVIDRLWRGLAVLCAGVVLAREAWVDEGAAVYRGAIDADIHPEGYLTEAVEAHAEDGLRGQLQSAQALVLMAEAGRQVGLDLWAYENRGVSAVTAATYPLYYYFYPEKWPWGEKTWQRGEGLQSEVLEETAARRVFQTRAGWLEMLNHYYGARPLKAVRLVLDDLRPVYDVHGGLTTLTHGVPEGRRGLFGR